MSTETELPLPGPGVHDLLAEDYHALPYLSATGMKLLINDCPAAFRHAIDHPEQDAPSRPAEIGTAAHLLLMEPELLYARTVVIGAADYRGKAAQETRAEAYVAGLVPILEPDLAIAQAMVAALRSQIGPIPEGIQHEVTYVWDDPETGVRCKARPDGASPGLLVDYKTTENAHPDAFCRRVVDNCHHVQAYHYLAGHRVLTGRDADWLWLVQSTKPPYLAAAHRPRLSVLHAGGDLVRAAIALWQDCDRLGRWPGYEAPTPDGVWPLELPGYALHQHEFRRERGDFSRPAPGAAALARAIAWQTPPEAGR